MVLEPQALDLIEGDETAFERGPLQKMAEMGQLAGYIHRGYWQCMDTLREKQQIEALWGAGNAPWKLWT